MEKIMKKLYLIPFVILVLTASVVKGQLLVNGSLTPDSLAKLISGKGVQILNAQINCGPNGYGKYNATNTTLGISEGLLLTTGTINNAIGPNDVGNKSTYWTNPYNGNPSTYPLLNNYTGRTTYEYCEFEFDIIPQGDTINFDFVFASEEYEEWVGSQYNDVFGFFISGPGIVPDAGAGVYKNIALIPNTSTPVTINSVNQNQNTAYYKNNNGGTHVQYDGYTRGLKAISRVNPCATYHLKLVVADASDKIYDSGVFIEKIQSNNILLLSYTAGNLPHMVEGCNDGIVTFKRPIGAINTLPLSIQYWLDGTATNGTDYNLIGSSPNPAVPKNIIIPAGSDSVNLPITTIADGLPEISEYIMVYLGNPYCSNAITDSLKFVIKDSLFSTISPKIDSICVGASVQMQSSGGSAFSWSPSTGLNNANISNPIATPSATTTYTMTTTASFCLENKTSTIHVSNIALSIAKTNVTCNGRNNGIINLTVTNGLTPYTYAWSGPGSFSSTNEDINNLIPGTYTVVVTDAKGCSKSINTTITEPQVLASTITAITYQGGYHISCNGLSNGSISLVPSGGITPYTYVWTGPGAFTSTSQNISGLAAGNYSVIITDVNGCTINKSITLTQPALFQASISSSVNVKCKGEATGSAVTTVVGGTPTYTYSWNTSPVQTTPVATNLYAGTYIVTVVDKNGCSDTAKAIINQPSDSLRAQITAVTQVLCNGGTTGQATVTPNGGTTPYTFSWNSTPTQNTATATNLAAGNYNVAVTDKNNCSVTLPVTITQPQQALVVAVTNTVSVLCKGQSNGSAVALASGGSGSYSYSWNTTPVQTTATATNLIAGNYIVSVTDNNGCSVPATANATVSEPTFNLSSSLLVSSFAGGNNISCNGAADGSIDQTILGGTTPYAISWTSSNGFTSSSEDISSLNEGSYYTLITDKNGCTFRDTASLVQPTNIEVSVSTTLATCPSFNNGAIDLTITGGTSPYTFVWAGPSGYTSTLEDISGLEAGNYNLSVTDANSCVKNLTITVTQPGTLTLSNTVSNYYGGVNVSCNGGADGSITLTPGGGLPSYYFSWTGPNGFTSTSQDLTGLEAGSYQVIFTDSVGCFLSDSIYLSQPLQVSATLTPTVYNGGNNITCKGVSDASITTITMGGSMPYTYSWTDLGVFTSTSQDISGLGAGAYFLTITDSNGCVGNANIILVEPDSLTSTISSQQYVGGNNISCFGLSNGSIGLTVSGGTTSYSYTWSGPNAYSSNVEDINNLAVGNYQVQIIDANGCVDSSTITLIQPDSLYLTATSLIFNGGYNVSCNGYSNGAIDLTVLGGTAPFAYNWSNGGITQDLNGLSAGSYSVSVTDTNNCTYNLSQNLIQPPVLQSGVTSTTFNGGYNVSCNGVADGSLDLQVIGGTPSYTYSWVGPNGFTSTTEDLTLLTAGTYQVTIIDTNNCSKNDFITLQEPTSLTTDISSPTFVGGYNLSCNGNSTGEIELNVNGGVANYNYSWTGPSSFNATTQDISGLSAGTYYVNVTDTNNCVVTDSLVLSEPNPLSSSASLSAFVGGHNIDCFNANTGVIDFTINGGTPNYIYTWNGPASFTSLNEDVANLIAGTYSVNVTDTNGCSYDTSFVLVQPQALVDSLVSLAYIGGFNTSCYGANDGAINTLINGGSNPYSINWSGPNGFNATDTIITGLAPGNYYYTITDANNCSLTDSTIITEPTLLTSNLTTSIFPSGDNISCKGDSTGFINTVSTGGNQGYTYNWSNNLGYSSNNQNIDSLYAATYLLTLIDTNGCVFQDSLTLSEPNTVVTAVITPSIYPSGDNISCFGFNNGSLEVVPNGGTPSYVIDWRGPNGYANFNSLIDSLYAGTYDVAITDSNGCGFGLSYTLIEPSLALALNDSTTLFPNGLNVSCNGFTDGAISLSPQGGTPAYQYVWSSNVGFNSSNEDINNIASGEYYIELIDLNNCTVKDTFLLSQPASMVINSLVTPTICGNPIGSINLYVQGYQPYTYQWSNGDTTAFISNLSSGIYNVVITDVYGCLDSTALTIGNDTNLISLDLYSPTHVGGFNISTNNGTNGAIDLSIIGGTSPYTITWSNGLTTEDISGLTVGNYSVTVSDANGCSSYANIILTEPLPLELPTGITPNGDGKNDIFFIRGLEAYPDNSLLIFNRWGNEVFSQNDYANDWNGVNSSGEPLPEGTYFVILKIAPQSIEMKGYLDIRR